MGILNCKADFMAAMLVDKNKSILPHWELNRFFLANSGMKIFTGICTVLSTNMAALSSCCEPVISLQITSKWHLKRFLKKAIKIHPILSYYQIFKLLILGQIATARTSCNFFWKKLVYGKT